MRADLDTGVGAASSRSENESGFRKPEAEEDSVYGQQEDEDQAEAGDGPAFDDSNFVKGIDVRFVHLVTGADRLPNLR